MSSKRKSMFGNNEDRGVYEPRYDITKQPLGKKVVVVGDAKTGKTCLIQRFTEETYSNNYVPTVFKNFRKQWSFRDKTIELNISDTAGTTSYDNIRSLNYPGTDLCIITFALDDPQSLKNVTEKWEREQNQNSSNSLLVLVGTKEDTRKENKNNISYYQGNQVARRIHADMYLECSAKDGTGIREVFSKITEILLEKPKGTQSFRQRSTFRSKDVDINELTNRVIEGYDGPTGMLDDLIVSQLEKLKNSEVKLPPSVVSETFFAKCFEYQFNKVLQYLIKNHSESFKSFFPGPPTKSYISQTKNEQVALHIMEKYSDGDVWGLHLQDKLNENILHTFLNNGFEHATIYLIDNFEVFDLCLRRNSAGETPLMKMVSQDNEELAINLWKFMVDHDPLRIKGSIKEKNVSGSNIFHLCADHNQYKLINSILEIMSKYKMFEEEVLMAINEPSPNGRKMVDLIDCEDKLLEIIGIVGQSKLEMNYVDSKGNTIFHRLAKKDHVKVLQEISRGLENEGLKKFLLQTNNNGNNPFMCAAIANKNKSLSFMMYKLYSSDFSDKEREQLVHHRNNAPLNSTLLSLVHKQGGTLRVPQTMILEIEREIHGTREDVSKCFRKHLVSSRDVLDSLQSVEDAYKKGEWETRRIWMKIFIGSFLMKIGFLIFDMTTDWKLVAGYKGWISEENKTGITMSETVTCSTEREQVQMGYQDENSCWNINSTATRNQICNFACTYVSFLQISNNKTNGLPYNYMSFPDNLKKSTKFNYSLFFVVIPWVCFIAEFFGSKIWRENKKEVFKTVGEAKSVLPQILLIFKIPLLVLKCFLIVLFWPIVVIWKSFVNEGNYETANGSEKIQYLLEHEKTTILSSRAQMIEVCCEASFQPLLQLYLALPQIVHFFSGYSAGLAGDTLEGVWQQFNLSTLSVVSSILSVANAFSSYAAIRKRGALDFGANPVGRLLLMLSIALQIMTRLTALVIYAYAWGPHQLWQMFASVLVHIFVMGVLHICTDNDDWESMKTGGERKEGKGRKRAQVLYNCVINGVSNLYLHNKISMKFAPRTDKESSSFVRQLIFDAIFITENVAIIIFVQMSSEIQKGVKGKVPGIQIGILLFIIVGHLFGLMMKWTYYKFFHLWRYSITGCQKSSSHKCRISCFCCGQSSALGSENNYEMDTV